MAHEFAVNAFFMACRKFMHMKISFMAFSNSIFMVCKKILTHEIIFHGLFTGL